MGLLIPTLFDFLFRERLTRHPLYSGCRMRPKRHGIFLLLASMACRWWEGCSSLLWQADFREGPPEGPKENSKHGVKNDRRHQSNLDLIRPLLAVSWLPPSRIFLLPVESF